MSVFKRGNVYWCKFYFNGSLIRETARTSSKTLAKKAEDQRRRELEEGYNNIRGDARSQRVKTLEHAAEEYLVAYTLRHRSVTFIEYVLKHLVRLLGQKMLVDITDAEVKTYQSARLAEAAAPKTINEEIGVLLRLLGERGDAIRARMKRDKSLKLAVRQTVGKAFSEAEREKLFTAALGARSPFIYTALTLALNLGLRDGELRRLTWAQIDWQEKVVTVGRSKTSVGKAGAFRLWQMSSRSSYSTRNGIRVGLGPLNPSGTCSPSAAQANLIRHAPSRH
jgi:integrase